jgi:hypothetical protein
MRSAGRERAAAITPDHASRRIDGTKTYVRAQPWRDIGRAPDRVNYYDRDLELERFDCDGMTGE